MNIKKNLGLIVVVALLAIMGTVVVYAHNYYSVDRINPSNEQNLISIKDHLNKALNELTSKNILTNIEAENLKKYLEENRPPSKLNSQQNQMVDPIGKAANEGIITQNQADIIRASIADAQGNQQGGSKMQHGKQGMPFGDQGLNQGGAPKNSSNMISVDDANEIEERLLSEADYTAKIGGYPIVDTGLTTYYSNSSVISNPSEGEVYYGQDANYQGNQPNYTDNGDGTVTDNVTGLMWQQDPGEKLTWEEAVEKLKTFNLAGYNDWRLPTIKELYSLVQFNGETGMSSSTSRPYIDTNYFEFEYGDAAGENRFIDSQMATSTIYDSSTMNANNTTMFGFNFADGRIKGYPVTKEFYVYFVRGNTSYGQNQFLDNGDGTITDLATGLMWMTYDSGYYKAGENNDGTMDWDDALEWCEDLEFAGYDDWKLPDAKELQSLVDYTKSPDTTNTAAIDDLFYCTSVVNFADEEDYGYYWSSTTHLDGKEHGANAVYIAFGRGMGVMNGTESDVHGAGCQRSDPKTGNRVNYPTGFGPQGDERRVFNMVRAVRPIN